MLNQLVLFYSVDNGVRDLKHLFEKYNGMLTVTFLLSISIKVTAFFHLCNIIKNWLTEGCWETSPCFFLPLGWITVILNYQDVPVSLLKASSWYKMQHEWCQCWDIVFVDTVRPSCMVRSLVPHGLCSEDASWTQSPRMLHVPLFQATSHRGVKTWLKSHKGQTLLVSLASWPVRSPGQYKPVLPQIFLFPHHSPRGAHRSLHPSTHRGPAGLPPAMPERGPGSSTSTLPIFKRSAKV